MKNIAITFLILNILSSTLMVPLIYLDFELRRDYIAEVLCIKKEEPITVCGGHCFLAKQLNKAKDQQQEEKQSSRTEQISFFNEHIIMVDCSRSYDSRKDDHTLVNDSGNLKSFVTDIFHPPQLV